MKIREITSVFKLFEVGEPQGSPEDPFGQGQPPTETENSLDLDSMMPGGGQPQENPDFSNEPPQATPEQAPIEDENTEEDHEIDSKLLDFAKNHSFFASHSTDEHPEDVTQMLSMSKDQLKSLAKEVHSRMIIIVIQSDAGYSYENKEYKYLQDKISFIKDLIKQID
jgi:hypothetical protein